MGTATSADKKSNVVVHGNQQSLAEIKPMVQQMIPPDKTIEDNGKRYWYSYKHLSNGGRPTGNELVCGGSGFRRGVCGASGLQGPGRGSGGEADRRHDWSCEIRGRGILAL